MSTRDIHAEFGNDFDKAKEEIYVANIIGFSTWAYLNMICKQCETKQDCKKCSLSPLKEVWDISKEANDNYVKESGQKADPNAEDFAVMKFTALLTYWHFSDQCKACEEERGSDACKECMVYPLFEYWRDTVRQEKIGKTAQALAAKKPSGKSKSKKKKAKNKKRK